MANSPFHVTCNTVKNIMSSVDEAKTGRIYMGGQRACLIQTESINLGHPQLVNVTPFYTYNSTVNVILTTSLRQKLSKSFDMFSTGCVNELDWVISTLFGDVTY